MANPGSGVPRGVATTSASSANPFNLDRKKKGGLPAKDYKAKSYTEDDQVRLLYGYMEIPADLWPFLRYGTHVRYVTKAGEFRPGGFVKTANFDYKAQGRAESRPYFKLQFSLYKNAQGNTEWMAAHEDLAHVYAKPDACALTVQRMLEGAVTGLNANVKKVALYAQKIEKRLEALEGR
jgi:hypothetical protein